MAKSMKEPAGIYVQVPADLVVRAAKLAALGWLDPPPAGIPKKPTPDKLILYAIRAGLSELERKTRA